MKSALAFATAIGLLLAGVAAADPSDCGRLMHRINHFEGMADRAEALGKDDWARKTQHHVELLEARLADRCPAYSARDEQQEAARQLALLLKVAATAAAKLFTLGAF
ncbi:MAG: hypothetical protein IH973_10790 [Myxococcales bacterium]|nr:hypothetical protein [Myxococcales bacterium]